MSLFMMGGAVLGGLVLGCLVLRFQARRFSSTAHPGVLSESHVGYLFGGKARASDVWWAQLVNGGHIERSGTRNLEGVLGWRRTPLVPTDPMLRSAWEALPPHSCTSWWHAHDRSWRQRHQVVQKELVAHGLLPSPSQIVSRQLQAVVVLVGLVGAAMISWALGAPWVGLALVVSAVVSLRSLGRPLDAFDTDSGHLQMKAWREQHAASTRAPQASTIGYAVAVAGMGALVGTPYVVHAREGAASSSGSSGGDGFSIGGTDGHFTAPSASAVSSGDYATSGGFGGDSATSSGDAGGSSGCGGGGCGGGGCGG